MEHLPTFATWCAHSELAHRLSTTLADIANVHALAAHPFRWLNSHVIEAERPLETLHQLADQAETLLDEVESALGASGLSDEHWDTLGELEALIGFAGQIADLAARNQLACLDRKSALTKQLTTRLSELNAIDGAAARAQTKTQNWREKLPAGDLAAAIALALANENSLVRLFKPSWWQFKKVIERRYEFSKHAVRPSHSQVLADLDADYAAMAARDDAHRAAVAEFGEEPEALLKLLESWRANEMELPAVAALCQVLLESEPEGVAIVKRLNLLAPRLDELGSVLGRLFIDFHEHDLSTIEEMVRDLREESDNLPDLLPLLAELDDAPLDFARALRRFDLAPAQLEAAIARNGLEKFYRTERWLPRFDGPVLAHRAGRIGAVGRECLDANATALRAEVRRRFREHVNISSVSATQLDADGKLFKKSYSAGRRDLEHEFGKTMRYKSIRDLAAGDTGQVVRDLKPIWLMSPLSVSDTLPLASGPFRRRDLRRSQPDPGRGSCSRSLSRAASHRGRRRNAVAAHQFLLRRARCGRDTIEVEEDGERVAVSLGCGQFSHPMRAAICPRPCSPGITAAAPNRSSAFATPPSTAAISTPFPIARCRLREQSAIVVNATTDAADHAEQLLARPLSFHFMESSPYEVAAQRG